MWRRHDVSGNDTQAVVRARSVDASVEGGRVPVVAVAIHLAGGTPSLALEDEPRAGRVEEFPPMARLDHDRVAGTLARLAHP